VLTNNKMTILLFDDDDEVSREGKNIVEALNDILILANNGGLEDRAWVETLYRLDEWLLPLAMRSSEDSHVCSSLLNVIEVILRRPFNWELAQIWSTKLISGSILSVAVDMEHVVTDAIMSTFLGMHFRIAPSLSVKRCLLLYCQSRCHDPYLFQTMNEFQLPSDFRGFESDLHFTTFIYSFAHYKVKKGTAIEPNDSKLLLSCKHLIHSELSRTFLFTEKLNNSFLQFAYSVACKYKSMASCFNEIVSISNLSLLLMT
jgi:hypothetical protein